MAPAPISAHARRLGSILGLYEGEHGVNTFQLTFDTYTELGKLVSRTAFQHTFTGRSGELTDQPRNLPPRTRRPMPYLSNPTVATW